MKKIKTIIVALVLAVVIIPTLTSCKKTGNAALKDYTNTINKNMQTCTKVKSTLTIKDTDILVYQQIKETTVIDKTKATIVFTTSSLDDSFELTTSKNTEVNENFKSSDLFSLTLQKELFKSYTLKDNNFNGEITKENISKVFNSDIEIKDMAALSITFENNKIKKIECTYETTTNRQVNLCTIYEY